MSSRNSTKMVEHKLVLFSNVIALWTLLTLLIKLIRILLKWNSYKAKLCHFGYHVVTAKLFCLKSFVPVIGLKCSYGNIFIPVTEISLTGPSWPLI